MKHFYLTVLILFLSAISYAGDFKSNSLKTEVDMLFIAKVILVAIIVLVGISALRTYLRQGE